MKSIYSPRNHTGIAYLLTLPARLSVVLFLLFVSRIFFFLYNQYLFPGTDREAMLLICRGGIRFDLSALFYLNGLYLMLSLLPFSFVYSRVWQGFLKYLFVIVNAAGFFFQIFDFIFFRTVLHRTDFSFFREFARERNLGAILVHGVTEYLLFFLAWVAVIALLWFTYGRSRYISRPVFTFRFFAWRLVVFCLALLISVAAVRGGTDRTTRPITLSNAAAYVSRPLETGIVLNTPFCILRTFGKPSLEKLHFFDDEEELEGLYSPLHRTGSVSGDSETGMNRKNVVILILESFSREYSGFLNPAGTPSYMPFLDSLMSCSLACSKAYANGRKSVDAIPSVLGSIPSLEQSFALTPYALHQQEGLGNTLKRQGYHTSFFHGAPNGSMGLDAMARQLGFDTYYGMNEFGDKTQYNGYWGIWDEPFLQFFARTLGSFSEPFATAVFTLSSHHPFVIPDQYEGVFPEGPLPVHTSIRYADHALRRFFEKAAKSRWYPNTLFVLVADHGTYSQTDPGYQSDVESMAVPVVYYDPSATVIREGELYEGYTQQIDIMPTVLHLLGYPDGFFAFGRSIRDTLTSPFVVHYPSSFNIMRIEKEKEPSNELFLKAFRQQYNNRLIEGRLLFPR